ncbi:uncharacterized protein PRCAT00001419001 [Priceomyces carsonii]|uniref:uncharacterized protein n=1 Tax=Priceomyces carsonii TaxID=28549 RepID=UPI002ED9389B|nr:unnamed protein product [Priceomyces carsonii]
MNMTERQNYTSELPPSQKASVYYEYQGNIYYKDIPIPTPKDDEILVQIKYSGICRTDLHVWNGDWKSKSKLPMIGGHEGVGVVAGIGSSVSGFQIDDAVGIKWQNKSCLSCPYCERGQENNCEQAVFTGCHTDGCFQQYAITKAIYAARFPKGTDLSLASPILCAGTTVYKALKVADIKAGEWVAITGAAGGLGTLAIQYAVSMGYRVLAIDCSEEKRGLAKHLGAEKYINFQTTHNIIEEVKTITDEGPAAVLAIAEGGLNEAVEYVRPFGTVVLIAQPATDTLKTSIFRQVCRCVTIRGSCIGNKADTSEAIDFYTRGLVKPSVTFCKLSEVPKIFLLMQEGKVKGRYVIDLGQY